MTGTDGWPVDLRGITESVVTTRTPGGWWNVAALGLHAGNPVTARTWGRTRTWRNFRREGEGVIQFVDDPRDFVEAALSVREDDEPVLESATAWVEVEVQCLRTGTEEGTEWAGWSLRPVEAVVPRRPIPTINRGFNAVIEATVAASRLDVDAYDDGGLLDRLAYLETVVHACGGESERLAFDRLTELIGWKETDPGT